MAHAMLADMTVPAHQALWPANKIEQWSIGALLAYPQNPRIHSEAQIRQVAASMAEFGVAAPALVDERGVLIVGHCRIEAAKLLGLSEYPVMVARNWTEEQKRAYRIADNKLTLNGG